MNKINIQFGGITRIPDGAVANDGDMEVLLNARHEAGELVPIKRPTVVDSKEDVAEAKYHAQSGCWLELRNKGADLTAIKEDGTETQVGIFNEDPVEHIELMGNIVILYKSNTVEYAIWRNGQYELLGELPEVPKLRIKITHFIENIETEGYWYYSTENYNEDKNRWQEGAKGFFDKCLTKHYKSGRFIDNALFIIGIKLFDGTYKYSHIYFVQSKHEEEISWVRHGKCTISSGERNFLTIARKRPANWGGGLSAIMNANILGFNVFFDFDSDFTKWKDVITGVDIFTSGSIMGHVAKTHFYNLDDGISSTETGTLYKKIIVGKEFEGYFQRSIPELREAIESNSSFFKYAEYNIKGELIKIVDNTSPSNLASQDVLIYSNVRNYKSKGAFVYNNRLHIYGYEENKMFPDKEMIKNPLAKESESKGEINLSVKFDDESVHKRRYEYTAGLPTDDTFITPYITFPEIGAKVLQLSMGDKYIKYNLKQHPVLDYSFCLAGNIESDYYAECDIIAPSHNMYDENEERLLYLEVKLNTVTNLLAEDRNEYILTYNKLNTEGVNKDVWVVNNNENDVLLEEGVSYIKNELIKGDSYGIEIRIRFLPKKTYFDIGSPNWDTGSELIGETNIQVRNNVLKVSAVDNPFYFPAAQTYKFDSPIVNIASNTETISQGQFGQYPLFVFTKSGIWAMAVDTSGKGAYVSQAPFSREVCNGEVLPISGGVVFGTDKGVMAISGGDVVELSQMLNGTSPFMFPYNEQLFGKIYELAGYSMALNPIDIKEYIKGAKFAYNYKTGEIIVCNHDYGFSYVYGLKTQKWTMSDVVFTNTTNSYPELVTYEGGVQMKWNEEDFENVPIVLITRPVKVDTLDFKRLRQAALRCTFEGSLNFYVLGSNDGVNFVCITGKEYPSKNGDEPTDVTRRDLITSMSRSKQYKYIAIAVAGKMRGRISLAELLVDAGFASNRLR